MKYRGRVIAACVVVVFNILRYVYYNIYLNYQFEKSFFILTVFFLLIAWIGGKQYDVANFYAEIDPLTNVYNRRTIDKVFKKNVSMYGIKQKTFGIALIDIDDFKEVNDTFGHQTGDELLRCVADLIMKNAKKEDYVIRWGGDEFVHVISDMKEDMHAEYIQNLRSELSNLKLGSFNSMSVSIGIAMYPDDGESFDNLVKKADTSMYKMKSA